MPTLALLGAAHIHTPGFIERINKRDDFTVKAVYDHNSDRAAANADKLSANNEGNLDAVLADGEVDAVIICSETNRHEDLVMKAAAAGKHMFVEKPLGFAAADAFRMADAITKARVTFQTGYFRRGDAKHIWAKQHIDHGSFGKITRARHNNCHSGSIGRWFDTDWRWMADPAVAGCGAFGDLGTHSLDILMWWFGDVVEATGDLNVVLGNYQDCDESGEGMIKFDRGVLATLSGAWVDVANPVNFQISGTEGCAIDVMGKLYAKGKAFDAEQFTEVTDLPAGRPHAFDLFLDAVAGKDVPLVNPQEAAARSAVMQAIHDGARQRTWIKPPTF